MKAVLIDRFGGPEELHIGEAPQPQPQPQDVLIRVAYASINPADYKSRAGLLPHMNAYSFPIILGMDGSGVVEAVGADVTAFKPGDRVITISGMGLGYQGTYAEYCIAPAKRVAPMPAHLSFAEGATIPTASACAANAILVVAKVKPGSKVLVNGAAGSVGSYAVQLLKVLGARVAATCSTGNVAFVRSIGADLVIDYTAQSIPDALKRWAPDGIDDVIDAIGQGSLSHDMHELMRPGGTLVCIMNLVSGTEVYDVEAAARRGVRIIDDFSTSMTEDPFMFQVAPFRTLLESIADGSIRPVPYQILPMEAAEEAHRRVATGHVRGKILLEIAKL